MPTNELCLWCEETTTRDDSQLVPYVGREGPQLRRCHFECEYRTIAGGVMHMLGKCSCYIAGAPDNDPPGMTKREAAKAAYDMRSFSLPRPTRGPRPPAN